LFLCAQFSVLSSNFYAAFACPSYAASLVFILFDKSVSSIGEENVYEPGVFDIRGPEPRPTAIASVVQALANGNAPAHPTLEALGWWGRLMRVLYGAPPATDPSMRYTYAPQHANRRGRHTARPTYVPDLVHATLDLLIDGAYGLWRLANEGALSWAELARRSAALDGVPTHQIDERPANQMDYTAPRPRFSALGSERGMLLPRLEDALERCRRECEVALKRLPPDS
jgi:hypothetical protein